MSKENETYWEDKLTRFEYKDGLVHLNDVAIRGVISYNISSVLDNSKLTKLSLDLYINSDITIKTDNGDVIYNYYDGVGDLVVQIVKDKNGEIKEIID